MYISKIKCAQCERNLDFKDKSECEEFCDGETEEKTIGMCKECGDKLMNDPTNAWAMKTLRKLTLH